MGRTIESMILGGLTAPLHWVERARGHRRAALIGTYGALIFAAGLVLWRQSCLRELPDIGEPFDVNAFLSPAGSGDDDAFEAFRRALDELKDRDRKLIAHEIAEARKADWRAQGQSLHAWHDRNREALELWREGAERPTATPPWLGAEDDQSTSIQDVDRLAAFNFLSLLEGAQREDHGDMAGAWAWYRALLLGGMHLQRRSGVFERLRGMSSVHFAFEEATEWAADPRVDAVMLRRAIDDVTMAAKMIPPDSETHKAEYVRLMQTLDDPARLKSLVRSEDPATIYTHGIPPELAWPLHLPGYLDVKWWLAREPERSRRAARIAYANWLAHCDGITTFEPPASAAHPGLFMTNPRSLQFAYIYPPELRDWIQSSLLWETGIREPTTQDNWRERQERKLGTLLITLAREAYRRDHDGQEAPSYQDLAGPYLDRLPLGYEDNPE